MAGDTTVPVCGDYQAVMRHLLAGEPLDEACLDTRRRVQRANPKSQQWNRARIRALSALRLRYPGEWAVLYRRPVPWDKKAADRARMGALTALKDRHSVEFQRLFTDELAAEMLRAATAGEDAA